MSPRPYTGRDPERLLEDLNPAQRTAVVHGGGPLLVVAGAGTGKTRVLTRRVGWLVAGGVPARSVLAVTFTNKAAEVLKSRLADLLPGKDVWAGTFHAFAARLLRRHGLMIGVSPDYTVLDREDQRRLLRDLLEDLGPSAFAPRPAEVAEMISHVKNGGGGRAPLDLSGADAEAYFERVRERYAQRLRAGNLLDFDDLLLQALRLLAEVEDVGERYRRRLAHVLVDEYQDTNVVQARLLKALLSPAQNLTVVGDPDQSIYRWRGAAVHNILHFEQEFPEARKVVLERNYRSTRTILDAAEHVIARNRHRHTKRLYTENPPGEPVPVVRCRDAEAEAEAVVDVLRRWMAQGFRGGDLAVFYRVNALSRALELALRTHEIPYVVVAGVEFFQRREVKDLLAFARLVENPLDEAAFLRIANVPRRGVGATSLRRLRQAALAAGRASLEVAREASSPVSPRARKGLRALLGVLDGVRELPRAPVAPLLEALAVQTGYRSWLAAQEDDVELSRQQNLDELVAYAHDFDRRETDGDLRAFLERTALVSDQDGLVPGSGRVSLMSVHAAKGLEFDCVAIAGAEDGLFPHARNADEPAGAEEERRLFYVAMTRAKQRLAVTWAARRFDWRGDTVRAPSPYLGDIPAALVRPEDRTGGLAWEGELLPPGGEDALGFVREVDLALAPGMRVLHPYFGEGRVADQQGTGASARVTVDFDRLGRKQLLLSHARLERLP